MFTDCFTVGLKLIFDQHLRKQTEKLELWEHCNNVGSVVDFCFVHATLDLLTSLTLLFLCANLSNQIWVRIKIFNIIYITTLNAEFILTFLSAAITSLGVHIDVNNVKQLLLACSFNFSKYMPIIFLFTRKLLTAIL